MKHILKRSSVFLLACAAALTHRAVYASAYSSAELGPITYNLVDLDGTDGVAAQLTSLTGRLTLQYSASTSSGVGWGGAPNVDAFSTDTKAYDVPFGSTQFLSFGGYRTASGPNGLSTMADVPVGGKWFQVAQYDVSFVLTPRTAIEISSSGKVALGVQVPVGSVVVTPDGYEHNGYFDWAPLQADSLAALYAGDHLDDLLYSTPPNCWSACEASDLTAAFVRSYSTVDQGSAKDLKIVLRNDSDIAVTKHFTALASQSGYATAPLSMVPEPAAFVQACLGLLSIGFVARRYRGSAKPMVQA